MLAPFEQAPGVSSDSAFDPFYADLVSFVAKRPDGEHRGTVRACIFDEGYADALDDTVDVATRIGAINFQIRRLDWAGTISTPPQSGDTFTSPLTGKTYAVHTVSPLLGDAWTLDAREVPS